MKIKDLETAFVERYDEILNDWKALLAFKSISTNKEYDAECKNCADRLLERLKKMGLSAKIVKTPAKPLVLAERKGTPGSPTVLIYGHYDVQPVEPLEDWKSDPFGGEIRDNKMYSRGASDNKGQIMFILAALETLLKGNGLSCSLNILLEGEEESGSKGLSAVMQNIKDEVKADLLYVSDTSMDPAGLPSITMGLRGISAISLSLKAYPTDLHSGLYGGAMKNPVTELARIIATLHDDSGKVAVQGFYDDLVLHSKKEAELSQSGTNADTYLKSALGAPAIAGEKEFSTPERIGFRPTVEVNGLHGGYGGPGSKTIIPSEAIAKLSMRLGTGQDPAKIAELVKKHLLARVPEGMKMSFDPGGHGGGAIRVDIHSKWLKKAEISLESIFKKPIAYRWEGGSIPVLEQLLKVSGAEPIFVGFGKGEDNWHAPNESLALDRFKQGYMFTGLFISSL